MQANYILDYDTLSPNKPHRIYLMARFIAGSAPEEHTRRPLNISLVIDRSGSMAGEKIDYTRQAAQFLVQNLSIHDTLSIVLYNDKVETLLMPEKVQRKDVISQRIASIKPSGTTNLSSGWLEGCTLVKRHFDSQQVNRVILISDGLANRGVTDSAQLVSMVQQKFNERITTTTMGLGSDFNEDLLIAMASAGGGTFYFIESPEVTPQIFQNELKGLLSVVGQNLTVGILPTRGVQVVSQLNAYPEHSDGDYTAFRMGDIFGDEVKALVLELDLPGYSDIGKKQIALLRFEYDELSQNETHHRIIEIPVMVHIGVETSVPLLPNPDVNQSVMLLKAAQARKQAIKAADTGAFQSAAQLLRDVANEIGDHVDDERLAEERDALRQQAQMIEKGAEAYNVYSRKTLSTQAFYTMTSRHQDTMMLRNRESEREGAGEGDKRATQSVPATGSHQPSMPIEKQPGMTPSYVTWRNVTFRLENDLIRIGRSSHNEIVIPEKSVSRFHCQIKREGDKLILEDLGSTNGTSLAGNMLNKPHILSVGDVIYICDEKLVFHNGDFSE